MSFSRLVAFRYLRASRENRHYSWITLLTIVGLALGVAALIVVLSVFNAFEHEVRIRLLETNAALTASLYPGGLDDSERWSDLIEGDPIFGAAIKATTPFVQLNTMGKYGSALQGIQMQGIDPIREAQVHDFATMVKPDSALTALAAEVLTSQRGAALPERPAIILGTELLEKLGADLGKVVQVVRPEGAGLSTTREYKVVGTYRSGLKNADNRLALVSIPAAQLQANLGRKVSGLRIALFDNEQSTTVERQIHSAYPDLTLRDWKSLSRNFLSILDDERSRVGLIVGLVGLVAGFNILMTTFVSVTHRQRDIAILKALGARNQQIVQIFLLQSVMIGLLGCVVGVILAGGISYILEHSPFIKLPDTYFLAALPREYNPGIYAGVSVLASGICLFAGIYPAILAARTLPTEGISGKGRAL